VNQAGRQRPADLAERAPAERAPAERAPAGPWQQYLDTLEQAVLTVETDVSNGSTPGWLGIRPPHGPVPDRVRGRCEMVLMLLDDVTRRTERRRADLRAQLAAMPHPRPLDHARAASLGHEVDVIS
jgi:hypothetical protein